MREPSNYPPGVTGNEPQITGEWPDDDPLEDATEVAEREAELEHIRWLTEAGEE